MDIAEIRKRVEQFLQLADQYIHGERESPPAYYAIAGSIRSLHARGVDPADLWHFAVLLQFHSKHAGRADSPSDVELAIAKDKAWLPLMLLDNSIEPPNDPPSVRLTDTDQKILATIDAHGHVESTSDLLDKMAESGEIMSEGTAKPRLAELKANKILAPWKGGRGYKRA